MSNLNNFYKATATFTSYLGMSALALITTIVTPAAHSSETKLPERIRIVVPFTPGGSNDIVARALAAELIKHHSVTIVVENKPGASGFIGAADVARSPKDGSTLMVTSVSMMTAAATRKKPSINMDKDLVPVAILAEGPTLLVASNKSGIRTPADLIAAAKANPGGVTYASVGPGTLSHLAGALIADMAGVEINHIPYKGGSPAMNDIIGGVVDFAVGYTSGPIMPQIKAGNMQLVAITSSEPSPALPGVPTMSSVIPGFDASLWTGVWAPAGTPQDILIALNKAINEIAKSQVMSEIAKRDSAVPLQLTLEETNAKVRNSLKTWSDLAKKNKIILD
jgi:tripartite-type tricarboxylate transporter receptor subunit TctC